MIKRTFKEIPAGRVTESDNPDFLVSLGWSQGLDWDALLQSKRVLIISEAGSGKTYECRQHAERLYSDGQAAFFVELSELSRSGLRGVLDDEQEARLDTWLGSQSEVATFFLDSIDELNLSLGSFSQALTNLKKGVGSRLGNIRVIVTSRPIPIDEQLMRKRLPIPPDPLPEPTGEAFADVAINGHPNSRNAKGPPDWRVVAVMPLSDEQILEFALGQGVSDASQLLDDLHRRNAVGFARRPQDLIEICADWRVNKRIRTHREQVESNVQVKLKSRDPKHEVAELSDERAKEGASQLALAMQLTKRLTIRYSAGADIVATDRPINPEIVLSHWAPKEREALLERPLFGFASYGRVRFHHRSVMEYLAAHQLSCLRRKGMSSRALQTLLFAETRGRAIVRPSKRPIAGWLALTETEVFEFLRDNEPSVLLDEGDPGSLTCAQRIQALRAYVQRYGPGGWRDLRVPRIQVHRIASSDLGDEIQRLWECGVENPDVRVFLLNLIEAGRIDSCANIPYELVSDVDAQGIERVVAMAALIAISDRRLPEVSQSIACEELYWPTELVCAALFKLFPKHMSVGQFCNALRRIDGEPVRSGSFGWDLPRFLASLELGKSAAATLRDGISAVVSEGLKWDDKSGELRGGRPLLSIALAAVCVNGLRTNRSDGWLRASLLALRLYRPSSGNPEPIETLKKELYELNGEENARLFWVADAFSREFRVIDDPRKRLNAILAYDEAVQISRDRDSVWIRQSLGDASLDLADREVLLEIAVGLFPDAQEWSDHLSDLRSRVDGERVLLDRLDKYLRKPPRRRGLGRFEKRDRKRRERARRKKARQRASWIQLWRTVVNEPDVAFSGDRDRHSAWYLWETMSRDGEHPSGWNRGFIERTFGDGIADRFRLTLMKVWREGSPLLLSERSNDKRNTIYSELRFGLSGIYAEAEDPNWAGKLMHDEAVLAVRFAPYEWDHLPEWMDSLSIAHPDAVVQVLGSEVLWELHHEVAESGFSRLLQCIEFGPPGPAALLIKQLMGWLMRSGDRQGEESNAKGVADRLTQVVGIIMKFGDEAARSELLDVTKDRLQSAPSLAVRRVWIPTALRLSPEAGVKALEDELAKIGPDERGVAVDLLARLFCDQRNAIELNDDCFPPQLLLRLLRLSFMHIRVEDAVERREEDFPNNAGRVQSIIIEALFARKGDEGWAAKMEMANDPLCEHFRDRIVAVAQETWAQEFDSDALDDEQVATLEDSLEAPPSTNEAMYAMLMDRLAQLDDRLLRDDSPRELWSRIPEEKLMRREIARQLKGVANGMYLVDQEAVTADEKETDIRLRSVTGGYEGVVELKIGEKDRSAKELVGAIEDQLVMKYLGPEKRRSGVLLITLAKERTWVHPTEGRKIDVRELMCLLREEAQRVRLKFNDTIQVAVHLLDLRPRAPVEGAKRSKSSP
ncbi:NACHT domain-containing protein [Dokdonella immobilis]|uniref:Uncharacterized protein n=1 Tax=Dokdonella immobilis TaxID=578942 RepID=A0A1I4XZI2_9GAMM|nr:ATP-binding protein [Dokdonella immobilis]SFN31166.1 hypothetical protein SAMN05216289_11366 [Dokdonella immobilis]